MNSSKDVTIDLFSAAGAVFRKWKMILLAGVLCGAVSLGFTYFFISPTYTSFFTAYINNKSTTESIDEISNSDISAAEYLAETYSIIIKSKANVEEALSNAELTFSFSEVSDWIEVGDVSGTQVIKVTVEAEDPAAAYALAAALEETSPDYVGDIIEGSSMKIITGAEYSTDRSSPSYKCALVYGALFGVLIMVLCYAVQYVVDQRIRSRDELFDLFGIPVIGSIHDMSKKQHGGYYGYYAHAKQEPEAAEEEF